MQEQRIEMQHVTNFIRFVLKINIFYWLNLNFQMQEQLEEQLNAHRIEMEQCVRI